MKVLISGGAGFIGSTVASACLDAGMTPVVLDNLSAGRPEFVRGRTFYEGDIADEWFVDRIFSEHPDIGATVHCAALTAVPASVADPLRYYRENVAKSVSFIGSVVRNGCARLIFSSSAAIYQPADDFTVDERSPIAPASPYARGKAMVEAVLADASRAYPLGVLSLRYFNPIGADPAMRTGLPAARPSHVLGKLIEAAEDGTPFLITGTDWPTRDGTGIRDYVHVWDLAQAHVLALRRFDRTLRRPGERYGAINLGTGTGVTVRELVASFEAVLGRPLDVREAARRPGDSAGTYTRSDRAAELLGWRATLPVAEGVRDSLRWARCRAALLGPP
jgi:UDP-glucose 4-epimerase